MGYSVLVVGLGRFGTAAALEAMALGHEVLAVDNDPVRVNRVAPGVTHAVELDARDESALRSIGAGEFDFAIIAISSSIETSIFATMAVKTLGAHHIVAKAASELHGAILERVGAERVVYPEQEVGTRVAHILGVPDVLDYLDVGPEFGVAKVRVPSGYVGRTLAASTCAGGSGSRRWRSARAGRSPSSRTAMRPLDRRTSSSSSAATTAWTSSVDRGTA